MINAYEIFLGFKNYLQDHVVVDVLGAHTRLTHSQELACIDLLFTLATESKPKKALQIYKSLSTLSNQRLILLKILIETPHLFKVGGRTFQPTTSSHLRYFMGCGLVFIIENRLQELGIRHAEKYQEQIQLAYKQLRINRYQLKPHSSISLKNFVAGRAGDHIVVDTLKHDPERFFKVIPDFANIQLKSLTAQNIKLNRVNSLVESYIVINLCLAELYHQLKHPQKTFGEFYSDYSDMPAVYLAVSLVLSTIYKLCLLYQKASLYREQVTMHSLFHKNAQLEVTSMCATIANENIIKSNAELKQGRAIILGRKQ